MASRRMVSSKVIKSARFLKMPSSTQNLYFHLILNADDDGIVEGFTIMRLIGSTEDDLKILAAKGFVHILNEDLVTFINDWLEHNKIRADRKVDSIYKDLLIQVLPDAKLREPKKMIEVSQMSDKCQTKVGIGKDRLGKDRLGKDSKDILSSSDEQDDVPYKEIVDYLNLKTSKSYKHSTSKTKALIKARWNEGFRVDDFKKVIDNKCFEWIGNPGMAKYLRPETLFGTKFEGYLNENNVKGAEQRDTGEYDNLF